MPKMRGSILISLLTALIPSLAQAQTMNQYHPFASQEEYADKVGALNVFVARFGRKRINRIFVAKIQSEDGEESLYGYWKEDNSILLLYHFSYIDDNEDNDSYYYWLYSKASIDLETEVVPTEEDINGSTYLVDKPWVDRIVKACLTKGRRLVIHKKARPKKRV
jgi:hypothetical protein